ncbi:hypothetical protein [Seleniivibrio woodruffii]|uniref:hypothetical protein n=1 Tax=Seleniivibrio woodruffii TaxID=1078050 RepID=UPI00240A6947|nr:hypothetical protein [Seleniivibrio woodruffii]
MSEIYKVLSTKVTKSKNGYIIYNLLLNNQKWVSKLAPVRKRDKPYDRLYLIYDANNSLDILEGKYVALSLVQNQYGSQISSVISLDVVNEFKSLLEKANGRPFTTELPIYDFLKSLNYKINSVTNSIQLKNPYEKYVVLKRHNSTICYQPTDKKDVLTLENIDRIYKEFYQGKDTGHNDIDCTSGYICSAIAIKEYCKVEHKYKSKTIGTSESIIMELGDSLNKEQIMFLAK